MLSMASLFSRGSEALVTALPLTFSISDVSSVHNSTLNSSPRVGVNQFPDGFSNQTPTRYHYSRCSIHGLKLILDLQIMRCPPRACLLLLCHPLTLLLNKIIPRIMRAHLRCWSSFELCKNIILGHHNIASFKSCSS